jgi:hypothetical protein
MGRYTRVDLGGAVRGGSETSEVEVKCGDCGVGCRTQNLLVPWGNCLNFFRAPPTPQSPHSPLRIRSEQTAGEV